MNYETTDFTLNSPSLSPDDERLLKLHRELQDSIRKNTAITIECDPSYTKPFSGPIECGGLTKGGQP